MTTLATRLRTRSSWPCLTRYLFGGKDSSFIRVLLQKNFLAFRVSPSSPSRERILSLLTVLCYCPFSIITTPGLSQELVALNVGHSEGTPLLPATDPFRPSTSLQGRALRQVCQRSHRNDLRDFSGLTEDTTLLIIFLQSPEVLFSHQEIHPSLGRVISAIEALLSFPPCSLPSPKNDKEFS